MTKQEIIQQICACTGVDRHATLDVIEAFMTAVKNSIAKGDNVTIRGFGAFNVVLRKEKKGRNFTGGSAMTLPAHYVVKFVAYDDFKTPN